MLSRFNSELYQPQNQASSAVLPRSTLIPPPEYQYVKQYPEALSSYLIRTANFLDISPSDLIEHFILPRTKLSYDIRFLDSGRDAFTINSIGQLAPAFESALQQLLPVEQSTNYSTFDFLRPLLGAKPKNVCGRSLKWCNQCIAEAAIHLRPVTIPLYWLCAHSKVCLIHNTYLSTICENCGKEPSVFKANTIQGVCNYCGGFLGERSANKMKIEPAAFDSWTTYCINELIREKQTLQNVGILKNFRKHLDELIEINGSAKATEKKLGLSESLITRWKKRNHPDLGILLEMLYRTNNTPIGVLLGRSTIPSSGQIQSYKTKKHISHKRSHSEIVQMEREICRVLSRDPKIRLKQLAKLIHVTPGYLQYRYPELVQILSDNDFKLRSEEKQRAQTKLLNEALALLDQFYAAGHQLGTGQLRDLLAGISGAPHLSMPFLRKLLLKNQKTLKTSRSNRLLGRSTRGKIASNSD